MHLHSSELGKNTAFPFANQNENHVYISLYVENLSPESVTQHSPSLASKHTFTEEISSNDRECQLGGGEKDDNKKPNTSWAELV